MRLVSAREIQQILGLARTTLWRLRQRPDFPKPIPLGLRVPRWRLGDVTAWLDRQAGDRTP